MRKAIVVLTLALLAATAVPARSATEVKMAGDARVYGVYFANRNFTGWNETGTQTEDRFTIWQRLRLRTDFVANENLKFRFGMRVDDETWGSGYLTAANPQVAIEPYLAYLQFKWPSNFPAKTTNITPPMTAIRPAPPCS